MLGTNPFAMAFPAKKAPPIIIDMATSATSAAALTAMLGSGNPMPPGILLDDFGEPTTDMQKYSRGNPPKGSMGNIANNYKGFAIQLATEVLGGVLPSLMVGSDAAFNTRFNNPSFLIAINISFFQDLDAFKEKIDSRIKQLKSSARKPGVGEIFMPGEQSYRNQERNRKEGIPVNEVYWNEIIKLAKELNVTLPDVATAHA